MASPNNIYKESFVATVFIFFSIYLLGFVALHLSALDPIHKALEDFDYSDLAYKLQSTETTTSENSEIVIAELAGSRADITKELQAINAAKPAVIGLDAWFRAPKDTFIDSELEQTCAQIPSLVMGFYLSGEEDADKFEVVHSFGKLGKVGEQAFVNFGGEFEKTIRFFIPHKEIGEENINSFATAILKKYDAKKYEKLMQRGQEVEYINYAIRNPSAEEENPSIGIPILKLNEIFESNTFELTQKLKGKIVLIGAVDNLSLEDLHFTPYNRALSGRSKPDMPGVIIHANILNMLLKETYIKKIPELMLWVFSFILCYLHVLLFIYFFVVKHIWYHLAAKFIQLITSVIILFAAVLLLANNGIKFEIQILLIPIFLSVDLLYFYDALVKFINKKFQFDSYFLRNHH